MATTNEANSFNNEDPINSYENGKEPTNPVEWFVPDDINSGIEQIDGDPGAAEEYKNDESGGLLKALGNSIGITANAGANGTPSENSINESENNNDDENNNNDEDNDDEENNNNEDDDEENNNNEDDDEENDDKENDDKENDDKENDDEENDDEENDDDDEDDDDNDDDDDEKL